MPIWLAQNGCKVIAASHNFFPRYDLYIDGVHFTWKLQPNFYEFDAYKMPAEWRTFLALQLHDALKEFNLVQRYPGASTIGWYKTISEDGIVDWCDLESTAFHIRYPKPESDYMIKEWWSNLEEFVRRVREVYRRDPGRQEQEFDSKLLAGDEELDRLWPKVIEYAEVLGLRRRG